MKVISIDRYRDGGTVLVKLSYRTYFINHKIGTQNQGHVFLNYEEIDQLNNSLLIVESELEVQILNAVISYLSQQLYNQK